MTLQSEIGAWHRLAFPDAHPEHIALKLCEEAGEVARCVNALVGMARPNGTPLIEELAQVVLVALALADRCGGLDLMEAVRAELEALRASATPE